MKKILMPSLSTQHLGKTLLVKGGWKADVQEIQGVDTTATNAYERFFQSKYGMSPAASKKETLERMQGVFETAWVTLLAESLRRYMRKYAKRFPGRVNEDGSLQGFDAAAMQRAWMPGENVGRRGKAGVEALFESFKGEEE